MRLTFQKDKEEDGVVLIRNAMKTPPASIKPSNTVAEAAELMDRKCIGSLPTLPGVKQLPRSLEGCSF